MRGDAQYSGAPCRSKGIGAPSGPERLKTVAKESAFVHRSDDVDAIVQAGIVAESGCKRKPKAIDPFRSPLFAVCEAE